MKILIAGGTGFIGSALCMRLLKGNDCELIVLSRSPEKIKVPVKGIASLDQLDDDVLIDVVINLAGEPIADKCWTDKQKKQIVSSRIDSTQHIIDFLRRVNIKPKLLINGSAIGYYGVDATDNVISEEGAWDNSFSSQLCQQWEAVALQAESLGVRTCLLRTGIVLGENGGALSKMVLPFKMYLGGRIGDGKQWMSWIHINDLVGIILYIIEHDSIKGAVNGTSPNPVTNQEFTKTLGRILKRPTFFLVPRITVKLLMGQMGEELLLAGKKIVPMKMIEQGYEFEYSALNEALSDVLL